MPGVLFLIRFNNFDRTVGFYLELHALTLATRSYALLQLCKGGQFSLLFVLWRFCHLYWWCDFTYRRISFWWSSFHLGLHETICQAYPSMSTDPRIHGIYPKAPTSSWVTELLPNTVKLHGKGTRVCLLRLRVRVHEYNSYVTNLPV